MGKNPCAHKARLCAQACASWLCAQACAGIVRWACALGFVRWALCVGLVRSAFALVSHAELVCAANEHVHAYAQLYAHAEA